MKVLPKGPKKLIDNNQLLGLDKNVICTHCNGFGYHDKSPEERCSECGPLVDSGRSPMLGLVPKKGA